MFDPDDPFPDSRDIPTPRRASNPRAASSSCCAGTRWSGSTAAGDAGLEWLPQFDPLIDRLRIPAVVARQRMGAAGGHGRTWRPGTALCLEAPFVDPQPLEPAPLLSALPEPRQGAAGRRQALDGEGADGGATQAARHCFDVDAADAHASLDALTAAAQSTSGNPTSVGTPGAGRGRPRGGAISFGQSRTCPMVSWASRRADRASSRGPPGP